MKFLFTVLISLLAGTAAFAKFDRATIVLSDELTIQPLAADVFLVVHAFPWPGNSLIIKIDSAHLLWVDTPYTPDATNKVLNWLDNTLGPKMRITQVNTGFHIDNLGGNAALKARNIPIYGSDSTCALLKSRSRATMQKLEGWLSGPGNKKYSDVYKKFLFVAPTEVFKIQAPKTITLGEEKVEIFFPGPSHTFDNLVVYIPAKQILFGGCMVVEKSSQKLGFIDDGDVTLWAKSLRKVKNRYDCIEWVVPGHGKPGGPFLLDHTIAVVDKHNAAVTP